MAAGVRHPVPADRDAGARRDQTLRRSRRGRGRTARPDGPAVRARVAAVGRTRLGGGRLGTRRRRVARRRHARSVRPAAALQRGRGRLSRGRPPGATAAFGKALETEHVPLQQQAYYNLGNAQFRLGERSEQTNPQETVGAWQAALKAYDGALRLDPKDDDARFNRELVQKTLEELQRRRSSRSRNSRNSRTSNRSRRTRNRRTSNNNRNRGSNRISSNRTSSSSRRDSRNSRSNRRLTRRRRSRRARSPRRSRSRSRRVSSRRRAKVAIRSPRATPPPRPSRAR